jgi:hypothetical protein
LAGIGKQIKQVIRKTANFLVTSGQSLLGSLSRTLPDNAIAKIDLLITLVRRDLSAKYKGSILGNLWPLLNQLSQLVIYTYVFSVILKVKLSISSLPDNNLNLWLVGICRTGALVCDHQWFNSGGWFGDQSI